jgi:protein translocase SecG subunit
MIKIFDYLQIGVAILLMASILLQHRGTSLGGAFGGEGNVYRSRRGAEKFLYYSTIVFAVIFVGLAIANLLVHSK